MSRVIHALLVRDEGRYKPLAAFAFRMIRNILTTPALYNKYPTWEPVELVLPEFERQFKLEFGFDRSMDPIPNAPFDFARESNYIMASLMSIECSFPTLRYVSPLPTTTFSV